MNCTRVTQYRIWAVIAFLHIAASAISQKLCFEDCWDKMTDSSSPFAHLEMLKELEGCQAPGFTVETIEGEVISLKSYAKSVIVMNFWFIGCKPCIQEIPRLNQLVTTFAGQDVLFLSFARDSKSDLQTKFITRWAFDYKIISGEYEMSKRYCIQPYPTHIVIGNSGKVTFASFDSVEKELNYDKLRAAIERALME